MIRVATIGTSTITHRFADAVRAVDGITVTHAYSRDAQRAAVTAAAFDATPASDLDALLGSADIDAVYVGSPNSAHHRQVLAALGGGKHVMVEKPAVPTVGEWDELVSAAAGLVLIEAMRTAYDPGLAAVREALPLLGTVRRVSLRYQKRSARYDLVLAGEQVNIFDPAMAGGALMDLGVYCAHALIRLFGAPQRVVGSAVTVRSGADGAGVALAIYDDFVADLSWSKITDSTLPSEVQGEHATLLIDAIDSARSLTVRYTDGRTEQRTVQGPANTMVDEVRRFAHLITSGDDHSPDQRATRQTLQLIEDIRASG